MRSDVTKKLFTVDEYYRMAAAGILTEDDRVELIEGEILEMSPIGHRHMVCVDRATDLLTSSLRGKALISVQNPLRLNKYNEPQPDIVVLKRRADYYASKLHTPEDTLLVLELSDTTLRYDTKVKLPIYAESGISEVWIENLQEDLLLVCRDPAEKNYNIQLTLRRGEFIAPLAFPDVAFKIENLLG
ncbi:MAG TPA: Uma2 family endonuclease [Terriglobia bacterium]|nr:Uma2 family endonuclease [Terriglobia bacterium]